MSGTWERDVDALLVTFGRQLVGDDSPETVEKVKLWALYSHIHKTMPALAAHWNREHPESKAEMRRLFEEIRELNRAHRAKKDG